MSERIMCPYCGPWNGYPNGVEMEDESNELADPARFQIPQTYWFACPVCGAEGPCGRSRAEATAHALRRFQPLAAPLAYGDAMAGEEVWIEFRPEMARGANAMVAKLGYDAKRRICLAMVIGSSSMMQLDPQTYGREWRAWGARPTDAEREAAKWGA